VKEDHEISWIVNNKVPIFDRMELKPNSALGQYPDTKILSASKPMGKKFAHIKVSVKKLHSSRIHENEKEVILFDSKTKKKLDINIIYLDITKSDKVELRIQHKNFEYIPRAILQNL
jgi:hypothetical protein